jgi:hypothetical protein
MVRGPFPGPFLVKPQRYILVLQPVSPWPVDEHRRLRALLKAALRQFGLRCISARPEARHDEPIEAHRVAVKCVTC